MNPDVLEILVCPGCGGPLVETLEAMALTLRYRGSDDQGTWRSRLTAASASGTGELWMREYRVSI
jgi:uncharacterized protein YbaR (Trm112 family)